jgi:ribosomal-protein-alanine N-acetyltransferase
MTEADLPVVLKLENEIFSDPWPKSAFWDQLQDDGWGAIVAECEGRVIGYACYMIVEPESHITNLAVEPDFRRKSVAKRLVDHIFTIAREHHCEYLILEVRPSNAGARAFYEKLGFRFLYKRPNYYRRPVEDALVLVYYFDDDMEED